MSEKQLQENVLYDADTYFDALRKCVEQARFQIDMEVYIYESKQLGKNVADTLQEAAKRGVTVRLLVDGVGADKHFNAIAKRLQAHNVEVRIHHPLPWHTELWRYSVIQTNLANKLLHLLLSINRRNHRKTILIDHQHLFLGSINVSNNHLTSTRGGANWRDTAIHVSNAEFRPVEHAFEASWNHAKRNTRRLIAEQAVDSPFLLNYTRKLRKHHDAELLKRIRNASEHILITNAYFVPEKRLLKALQNSAKRGLRVCIILPARSDVFFMPWVSAYFYRALLRVGVQIFEYTPSMLHAKTMIIDDWCTIGSSNLNHRSFRHDLEVDYVLQTEEAKRSLRGAFERDLKQTEEQKLHDLVVRKGWRLWLGALILTLLGPWL